MGNKFLRRHKSGNSKKCKRFAHVPQMTNSVPYINVTSADSEGSCMEDCDYTSLILRPSLFCGHVLCSLPCFCGAVGIRFNSSTSINVSSHSCILSEIRVNFGKSTEYCNNVHVDVMIHHQLKENSFLNVTKFKSKF